MCIHFLLVRQIRNCCNSKRVKSLLKSFGKASFLQGKSDQFQVLLVVDTSLTVPADQSLLTHTRCGLGGKNASHDGLLQAGAQTRDVPWLIHTAALHAAHPCQEPVEAATDISLCTVSWLLHCHPASSTLM